MSRVSPVEEAAAWLEDFFWLASSWTLSGRAASSSGEGRLLAAASLKIGDLLLQLFYLGFQLVFSQRSSSGGAAGQL